MQWWLVNFCHKSVSRLSISFLTHLDRVNSMEADPVNNVCIADSEPVQNVDASIATPIEEREWGIDVFEAFLDVVRRLFAVQLYCGVVPLTRFFAREPGYVVTLAYVEVSEIWQFMNHGMMELTRHIIGLQTADETHIALGNRF